MSHYSQGTLVFWSKKSQQN